MKLRRQPVRAELLSRWLAPADVSIANLEMVLSRRGRPADKLITLRGDPVLGEELAGCGFTVVTLATNHALDYGPDGLQDTIAALDAAGLAWVGVGRGWDEAIRPLRVDLPRDRLLWVVNFACTLPPGAAAAPGRPGVAPIRVTQQHEIDPVFIQEQPGTSPWVQTYVRDQDLRAACETVARARAAGGLVLVSIHWGVPPYWQAPFQGELAAYQRPLARNLIRAGAHAIVGHHPHVLHGVEIVEGHPVFYSLGNFIWHPVTKVSTPPAKAPAHEPGYSVHWREALSVSAVDPRKRESILLLLRWCKDRWEASLTPLWLDEAGEPRTASPDEAEQILARLQLMSQRLGTPLTLTGGLATLAGEIDG